MSPTFKSSRGCFASTPTFYNSSSSRTSVGNILDHVDFILTGSAAQIRPKVAHRSSAG
ncbi:hypothetical protein PanWU01x14_130610, partial [Parasponia andersonii]